MLRIKAAKTLWSDRIDLLITERLESGKVAILRNAKLEVIESGQAVEPSLSIEPEAAQMLIDALWDCGLRPSEGSGSAGSLAATQKHLKDMQSIAFGLLKKQGVAP